MIFRRDKKRRRDAEDEPTTAAATDGDDEGVDPDETDLADPEADGNTSQAELDALDAQSWRDDGPWDISEIEDREDSPEDGPRIDLGSLVVTGVPGSELRLQVDEESGQIVSAMLVVETAVEPAASARGGATQPDVQVYNSALQLEAFAAPRSGGLWSELRDELSAGAAEAGGTASLTAGPFGVELRRIIPVTTPEGEEGYQPSRMWVAEGPRWLLRGIVYGQAAVEEDADSPVVSDLVGAFRQVVVRRGDEAMAPGDLLPLNMPEGLTQAAADEDGDPE